MHLRLSPFNYTELELYFQNHGIITMRYGQRFSGLGDGFSFYVEDPDGNQIEFVAAQ
jgi:catechol 2,3-dioxygenase-like lactoylglutathione lyase family enzyme